jgi:hypothetical protein
MANVETVTVREDGELNVIIDVVGTIDTSDVAYHVVANVATLGFVDPGNTYRATMLHPIRLIGNVSDGCEVSMYFDAATPVLWETFYGRLDINYRPRFGAPINKATNPTGSIGLATTGFQVGSKFTYTMTLEMLKSR